MPPPPPLVPPPTCMCGRPGLPASWLVQRPGTALRTSSAAADAMLLLLRLLGVHERAAAGAAQAANGLQKGTNVVAPPLQLAGCTRALMARWRRMGAEQSRPMGSQRPPGSPSYASQHPQPACKPPGVKPHAQLTASLPCSSSARIRVSSSASDHI